MDSLRGTREAGKDQLDSLQGTREAGKDQLDSLRGTREARKLLLKSFSLHWIAGRVPILDVMLFQPKRAPTANYDYALKAPAVHFATIPSFAFGSKPPGAPMTKPHAHALTSMKFYGNVFPTQASAQCQL